MRKQEDVFLYQAILKVVTLQMLLDVLTKIVSPASNTINFAKNAKVVIFCLIIAVFNALWTIVNSAKKIIYVFNVLKVILCIIITAKNALFWIVYFVPKIINVICAQRANN